MDRVKTATEMFDTGYNCAQALLGAFAPDLGLDREIAVRLAATLGGGLSRTGGTCGAAMGALLVLGLRHGHTDPEEEDAADLCRAEAQEFLRRFGMKHGGTTCPEVLTADLSQPGELERAQDEGLFGAKCNDAVRNAAEILEELI